MNLFAPSVLSFFLPQKKKSHFPRKKKKQYWGKCLGLPHTGFGPKYI